MAEDNSKVLPLYDIREDEEHGDDGRFHPVHSELPSEEYRSAFWRDYARLIHSPSFRRLAGKTQLYPGLESDFFRNRLTHSIEVAQVARSVAKRLNHLFEEERGATLGIDLDLVEFAASAHDLGHPPFGHQGEEALDRLMVKHGGFEGNAQTLRILARVEKRLEGMETGEDGVVLVDELGRDMRAGLNLTFRSLASIIKYDSEIPSERPKPKKGEKHKVAKGYYASEKVLVHRIKKEVLGDHYGRPLKTLECSIMDVADDIAYSTYDLEDALKAGFIEPLAMLNQRVGFYKRIADKMTSAAEKEGREREYSVERVIEILRRLMGKYVLGDFETEEFDELIYRSESPEEIERHALDLARLAASTSEDFAKDGYFRSRLSSRLVGQFVRGVELNMDGDLPALWRAQLKDDVWEEVEALKTFTYETQIESPRLRVAEYRGSEIVTRVFKVLSKSPNLLPYDVRRFYDACDPAECPRAICDYVASMTDRYLIEFYGRLTSENPQTIFKPY